MEVYYDPQTFLRQRAGGISRLFCDLIREFDQTAEYGVDAVLPFRLSNNTLAATRLPHRRLLSTPPWLPRGALYAPWWLRGASAPRGCDVVHYTYYSHRFLGAPQGAKQVSTVHDMIPELFAGTEYFTASHLGKHDYVERSDLVICVSESTREDMLQIYGAVKARTIVVPNAVQAGFQPGLDPVPGLPTDYLLYVGKRSGYKDFGLLPQALEHMRDARITLPLVVVGAPLTTNESDDLDRRHLSDLVIPVRLGDEQLRHAYANCSVLVQTSRYEGFGLTALEGMASGVPVVIANTSSMPEVGGSVAQYFEAGDAESLADTIGSTLQDTALVAKLKRLGPERASNFTPALMAQRTADAYREILDE